MLTDNFWFSTLSATTLLKYRVTIIFFCHNQPSFHQLHMLPRGTRSYQRFPGDQFVFRSSPIHLDAPKVPLGTNKHQSFQRCGVLSQRKHTEHANLAVEYSWKPSAISGFGWVLRDQFFCTNSCITLEQIGHTEGVTACS